MYFSERSRRPPESRLPPKSSALASSISVSPVSWADTPLTISAKKKHQQGIVSGATSDWNTDPPFEKPQVVKESQTAIEGVDLA